MVQSSGLIFSALLLSAVATAQTGNTVAANATQGTQQRIDERSSTSGDASCARPEGYSKPASNLTATAVEPRQPGTNLAGAGVDTLQPGMSPAEVLASLAGRTVQAGAVGQAVPPAVPAPITRTTAAEIEARATKLSGQAKTIPSGSSSVTLEKYPGHFTMLTVRAKSGGAEMHQYYNDIFVVIDGEATEMTGGTIVDAKKDETTGETRGTRVEGATGTPMRKGDVIHIAPNVPHQTMVEPGKTFTYYVIKVAVPSAPVQ